jgi:drug/metabolite transporter (DMT)-like permease
MLLMNEKRTIYLAPIYLFCATLFWAGNFIIGKTASINEIPPISLNLYRWLIAWFILLPFTYKELIKKKKYILKNFGIFIILGMTAVSIFNSALFYSLKFTQVITGVLMISVVPVMIIFFSALLKIEKTNIFQIFGVALSLTGVVFIITKADIEILKNLDFNRGDLTMLIAMFSWAIYSALLKKKKYELSQITLLQVVIGFGVIILIPFYFIDINIGNEIKFDMPFFLILTYVIFFPGLISFFLWIKGVGLIGANRAGVYLHLMPILGAIMAMIIFDEKIMFYHFVGAIFIVSGIFLSNRKKLND